MAVYILGGGPTGLAIADGFADAGGVPFVVIERGPRLGGLAQTSEWPDVGLHDLGPHKIFTLDRDLMARVEALLTPGDWLTREKIGSIFMRGKYLPYPPSPFSLAGVFGLPAFVRMVAGYAAARVGAIGSRRDAATFEDDLVDRVGKDLYEVLFKPIALKLWSDPARIDVKLSRGRVQTPKLTEVIGRLVGLKKGSDFEALTFRYPQGGLQRLWDAIERKSQQQGQYLRRHSVEQLEVRHGRVTAILCRAESGDVRIEVGPDDFVVSSLPLGLSAGFLKASLPAHIPDLVSRVITLNDLLLVFFHVDTPSLLDESWIFVPDPAIVFHRVSEQESFDPSMIPNGSVVCCEIMSNDVRPMKQKSDDELVEMAWKGLSDMGKAGARRLGHRVIRLPQSYPVFRPGFEQGLQEILEALDKFENFRSLGRQGAFNYIGTLDAMDIGYGFARWYASRDPKAWAIERERTNHYPVLD